MWHAWDNPSDDLSEAESPLFPELTTFVVLIRYRDYKQIDFVSPTQEYTEIQSKREAYLCVTYLSRQLLSLPRYLRSIKLNKQNLYYFNIRVYI